MLLKPAPEAVATAVEIVRHAHAAGVPDDVVQLVRCPDDDVGRHLVTHPGVDGVVLTGSYDTARSFLEWRPDLHLLAETSGKNALVISQTADVDLALRDLVRSAFGHAGQKCSAASLAIVEAPLHDDGSFLERLADAVRSLRVGPATELTSVVGPLIAPPSGPLARALTSLDPGESWLVAPRQLDAQRPAVVARRPHRRAAGLVVPSHRVLRAGPRRHPRRRPRPRGGHPERRRLRAHRRPAQPRRRRDRPAGWNRSRSATSYVNRHTTGAIVRRQPFGGWKRSSIGRGAKTGGPGDVLRFVTFPTAPPGAADGATESYRRWWAERYGVSLDRSGLRSERNELRYRPVRGVVARIAPSTPDDHVRSLRSAAAVAGVPVEVSAPPGADGHGRRRHRVRCGARRTTRRGRRQRQRRAAATARTRRRRGPRGVPRGGHRRRPHRRDPRRDGRAAVLAARTGRVVDDAPSWTRGRRR